MAVRSDGSNLWSTVISAGNTFGSTDLACPVDTTLDGPTSPAWMVVEKENLANVEVVYFDGTFDGTTFRVSALSSRFKQGSAAGSGLSHAAGVSVVSSPLWSQIDDVWDYIEAHEAATNVHGAVSTATANTIVRRDASGRFRAADPSNDSDVATKGYVDAAIPIGGIIMWSGSVGSVPAGWALCDGSNGTPDLRNRFIVGAGSTYSPGTTGGAASVTLTASQMPSHTHGDGSLSTGTDTHSHPFSGSTGTNNHTHSIPTATAPNVSSNFQYVEAGSDPGTGRGSMSSDNTAHFHTLSGTTDSDGHGHTVTGSTASAGSGGSHENRPPYYALALIMRIA